MHPDPELAVMAVAGVLWAIGMIWIYRITRGIEDN
jgi:hypothetical protein